MEGLFAATLKATAELRQKDPLASRRKRRQRPSNPLGGMGGVNLHDEMKGMMGTLSSEDKKKADQLWKMLDNMYESDPAEYQKFIEAQMKLGEEHKQKEAEAAANGGSTSSGSTSGVRSAKGGGRSFTPNTSFVVKAYGRYLKSKIFLNMCCHEGVQRPMGSSGKEVEDETQPHLARQIPLLVGAPREMKDASGVGCTAVDVVFNPWVTKQAEHNTMFKSQIVDLAMKWINQDYPEIKFDTRWKTPNSKYKGGTGSKGNHPIPFPIEMARQQSNENGDDNDDDGEDEVSGSKKMDDGDVKSILPSFVDPLSSPASLLAETRKNAADESTTATNSSSSSNDDAAFAMMNINAGSSSSSSSTSAAAVSSNGGAKKKKNMIQELDANGKEVPNKMDDKDKEVKKNKTKKTKTKKAKTKKPVKKGFLLSGDTNLYGPEGSQETGFVTGRPKKGSLLDRCKVVDTRSMSKDTLDQTMKEYAETGTTSAPGTGPRTKATQPIAAPSKKNKKKKISPTVAPTATTTRKIPALTKQQEDEFDRLMAAADPEALSDVMSNVMGSGGLDALGLNGGDLEAMQKMLFSGEGGMGGMNNTTRTTKKKEASSMEPMAPESTPALKGAFNLPTLQHTMEVTTNKKGVNVVKIVVECPKNIIDFNQLELDLSDKTMRLKVPGAQPFVLKFPQKVLSTQTKAKFKKKNNSLVVSIPTSQ